MRPIFFQAAERPHNVSFACFRCAANIGHASSEAGRFSAVPPSCRQPLVISVMRVEAPATGLLSGVPAMAKPIVTTAATSMHSAINW